MVQHRKRQVTETLQATMLRTVVSAAKRAKVHVGIGGGVAVAARGYRRDTVDVDAFFHYDDRQKVIRALRLEAPTYRLESIHDSHWIAVPPEAVEDERIDLMFATGDPEESAIELSQAGMFRGVSAPMFLPEWLVICKYLADRNEPKDWLDILALYQRGTYDVKAVMKLFRQMDMKEEGARFSKFLDKLLNLKKK